MDRPFRDGDFGTAGQHRAQPDGDGANEANAKLRSAGFNVVEVDTSEFMKSGGSVFCLKMMVY